MLKVIMISILSVAISPSISFPKESGREEFKLPDFSKESKALKERSDSDVVTSCTNESGQTFEEKDKGFDACAKAHSSNSSAASRVIEYSENKDIQSGFSDDDDDNDSVGVTKTIKFIW